MPGEEEIIIIGGGPKKPPQPLTSLKPQGVESLRVMAKKYTTWVWGFVAALPQLYTTMLALGPIPASMERILWGTAAFGLFCSWVKQRVDGE
ncbi:hypothetical protein [Lysobacter antibioticus]|uniref:Uncharacterized protein n=1 Tax=Lysobacter antibioticus TaxID=84531 RepID=A0A0S2F7F3_LYSAN|nr:hypothetical protein [Lysobacter antibioticus]ALN79496.1 hypothetical protein LA76x_1339 [Lysobacter antibioticus]